MLILTRKPGQGLRIMPHETLDPNTPVGELFKDGAIEIIILKVNGHEVRLGIKAHPGLLVLREELDLKIKKIRV